MVLIEQNNEVTKSGEMAMDITGCLLATWSPDSDVRNKAETALGESRDQNLQGFLLSLSIEISSEDKPTQSREIAGYLLNYYFGQEHVIEQWVAMDTITKSSIKNTVLHTLGSHVRGASHVAAQIVARISTIEIPRKEWPELLVKLLTIMTHPDKPAYLKQATMETLGYVFEEISNQDLVRDEKNLIVAALVRGISDQNPEVRLAAVSALFIALKRARINFENQIELNFMIRAVCGAALAQEREIKHAAFECLLSIALTHYKVPERYMQTFHDVYSCTNVSEGYLIFAKLHPAIDYMLEQTLSLPIASLEDREKQADLQASLCSVLRIIIQKLSSSNESKQVILQFGDRIMMLFLNVLACRNSTLNKEAMLAISALACAIGAEFGKYMPEFYKYLQRGLQSLEYELYFISIGAVSDICRALDYIGLEPYCDNIMTLLLEGISRCTCELRLSIVPHIFSCIGDMAYATGENFKKYYHPSIRSMWSIVDICATGVENEEIMEEMRRKLVQFFNIIDKRSSFGPQTTTMCAKYEHNIIYTTDSRTSKFATGRILCNGELKLKCFLDVGIYATFSGCADLFYEVYNKVSEKYSASYVPRDVKVIANYIARRILTKKAHDIEIVIGGIGQSGILQMFHIVKNVNETACVTPRDFVIMGTGAHNLPLEAPIGTEEEIMIAMLDAVRMACLRDWASGGILICASLRDDGTIRKMILNPIDVNSCVVGYHAPVHAESTFAQDLDTVGVDSSIK